MTGALHEQIREAERLANTLGSLLTHNSRALERGNMRSRTRGLVRWADGYHHGLRYGLPPAAGHDSAHGEAWMAGYSDRLRLESGELTLDARDDYPPRPEIEDFIESAHQVIRVAFGARREPASFPPVLLDALLKPQPSMPQKERTMLQTRVKDLMKKNPVIIPMDYTLKDAAQEMEAHNCGVLPVGTPEKLEGVITDRDIVLRAVAKGKDINTEKVEDYMTPEVCSIREEDTTDLAADLMREKNISRVLVEDEDGKPCGILSFGRIIRENNSLQEIATVIEYAVKGKAA